MHLNHLAAAVSLACAALSAVTAAQAADTGAQACKTTAECVAQAEKIGASAGTLNKAADKDPAYTEQFSWLNRINKASIVMLAEEDIVSREQAAKIAQGVRHAITQGEQPDGKRPSDVLQIERIMIDAIGPEASLIHAGRSRQDMYATYRMALLRTHVLVYAEAMNRTREHLLRMAGEHVDTLVPAYTNGVQAMPISYAHYLLAYEASFARDAQRIRELYARMNRSAMGTAVLANSSWPLNRERLADLLGFDGVIENSLDAGQVITYDVPIEAASLMSSGAIRIGAMIEDIHTQYHQTRPWLLLAESATYGSSAMPQKRNPGLVMRVRETATDVVGLAHTVTLRAHNVTTGMTDYKSATDSLGLGQTASEMFARMDRVLEALVVDKARALEELEAEWTTSMELADTLQRLHQVPFRIGHSFASMVVSHARKNDIAPRDFPYAEAQRLYGEAARKYEWADAELPVDELNFRATLSPTDMVRTRVGTGGPQPEEVNRMLQAARQTLEQDTQWLRERREAISQADVRLDAAFDVLADGVSKPAG